MFLGAATGARGQLGVANVVARSDRSLPSISSRLAPPGIAARLAMGALAAGLFAQTRQAPWLAAAAIGASSAAVAAKVGHDVRARLAHRAPDPAVAVEDAVALGLAAAGASR